MSTSSRRRRSTSRTTCSRCRRAPSRRPPHISPYLAISSHICLYPPAGARHLADGRPDARRHAGRLSLTLTLTPALTLTLTLTPTLTLTLTPTPTLTLTLTLTLTPTPAPTLTVALAPTLALTRTLTHTRSPSTDRASTRTRASRPQTCDSVGGTRSLKPVDTAAALASGSATRPPLPHPWASALPFLLGSGPSPFEATRQPSKGRAGAEALRPNPLTGTPPT